MTAEQSGELKKLGPEDRGFSREQIDTTLQTLDLLFKSTDINPFDDITRAMQVLKDQRPFAEKRQNLGILLDGQRNITKRNLLKAGAITAATTSIGGIAVMLDAPAAMGRYLYNNFFSPEAIARQQEVSRAREEQRRIARENYEKFRLEQEKIRQQQERAIKLEYERTHTLGTQPSTVSVSGWRIKSPDDKQFMTFLSSNERQTDIQTYQVGREVTFPGGLFRFLGRRVDTGIKIIDYDNADGKKIPRLSITTGYANTEQTRLITEEWLLREKSADNIDSSIVIFENPEDGVVHYVSIRKTNSSLPLYEVKVIEPK